MDDETIRIAVGLRLGAPLCVQHHCQHCNELVDESGTHGLSCIRSEGRLPRHSDLNLLIQRSLTSINIPSVLEPSGLYRRDGRRPDGLTMIPWLQGRALLWDVTVRDTFAPSYLQLSSSRAGAVADSAAGQKRRMYEDLHLTSHCFIPLAFETAGAFAKDTLVFIRDLSRRIRASTGDPLSLLKLCQRVSVSLQRFNALSIRGSVNLC